MCRVCGTVDCSILPHHGGESCSGHPESVLILLGPPGGGRFAWRGAAMIGWLLKVLSTLSGMNLGCSVNQEVREFWTL